ncbi:MAG: hypothetical protein IJ876_02415 [Elusimicrobiaceae bacterium]|nr:hypothetical protein [Elusimicrobiaceae bacterium]
MKKWVALFAGLLLTACAPKTVLSPSYDFSQINRIGIMAFSNAWTDLNGVENLFAKYLIHNGFKVVERAKLESILQEHNISVSGYLAPETTREIGRILGVDVLLIGEVSSYSPARTELAMTSSRRSESRPIVRQDVMRMPDGSYVGYQRPIGNQISNSVDVRPTEYTINAKVALIAKLVDVETAEIVWIGSDSEESSRALDAADYMARKLVKSFSKELAKREKTK